MAYGRYDDPPALKNNVELQLRHAFNDGNWPTAIRLAERWAKSTKDPYYDVGFAPSHERPSMSR
jgi:hypothetical protein